MLLSRRFAPWLRPGVALAIVAIGLLVAFAPPSTRRVLLNSAWLAGGAAALALPLGTLLAVLLSRFELPGRRAAMAALGLLLFLPLYVQVSGWDAAIGKLGWYTLAFGTGERPWLVGLPAAIFLHAIAAVPWVALVVGVGLAQVDSQQEEAALLETSPTRVLWRITLPQASAFLIAAALWVAVATVSDMTVTNIYLIDPREMTYTEQFYMNYSTAADAQQAVLAVLPGLAGLALVILMTLAALVVLTSRPVPAGRREGTVFGSAKHTVAAAILLWSIIVVLVAVPLASLVTKAGFLVEQTGGERVRSWSATKTLEVVAAAPAEHQAELQWMALIAAAAATLALVVSLIVAVPARRGGWWVAPALVLAVLALATPGPLVGVGLIRLLNQESSPTLIYLYDKTAFAPIVAQAVHAFPVTLLLVWHSLATLSDDELAAASLDGAGPFRRLWLIALPQRWLALAGGWLAALAIAAGDLAWSHLVVPPGIETIQRRVFGLVHYGAEEQVAGICLVVSAAYAVLAAAIVAIARSKSWVPRPR